MNEFQQPTKRVIFVTEASGGYSSSADLVDVDDAFDIIRSWSIYELPQFALIERDNGMWEKAEPMFTRTRVEFRPYVESNVDRIDASADLDD